MVTELHQPADLDQLLQRSATDRILIFKHSTQCSVSAGAYDEFLAFVEDAADVPCGLVLVIEDRALSDRIESQLGIRHESPQAIVVENGKVRWTSSHWSITADALKKALRD